MRGPPRQTGAAPVCRATGGRNGAPEADRAGPRERCRRARPRRRPPSAPTPLSPPGPSSPEHPLTAALRPG